MAKGLEDTAFYRNASLLSRNEVGADPLRETPPRSAEQVHDFFLRRQQRTPHSLSATSTHDTKRSEDARARINVLSEIPERWSRSLGQWHRINAALRSRVCGLEAPSPDEEIRIYQTLLGVWSLHDEEKPGLRERVSQFLVKSCREGKLHSDWLEPNEPYEQAVVRFAAALIEADPSSRFGASFRALWRTIAYHGAWNSLSQVLIKITAPGIPDFYQGTELWSFEMVDPDNRQPVDYTQRSEMLAQVREIRTSANGKRILELARRWQDGRIKLFIIDTALDFRREEAALFSQGEYLPLEAQGPKAASVFAFARRLGRRWVLTIAPRLTTSVAHPRGALGAGARWDGTVLKIPSSAPSLWTHLFKQTRVFAETLDSGKLLDVAGALDDFPVCMLVAEHS